MTILKRLVPAALIVLAMASVAQASGGGASHEGMFTTIMRVVNFIIFLGLIYKFAGKAVADMFGGRRKQIKTQLSDLASRKKDAEGKLADVEKSIANIAAERDQIIADAVSQGESIKAGIIENAHDAAERIKEQAKLTAANERQAALKDIRAEVAEMVVEAAEKVLAGKLSADEHDKLINNYLEKVVLN